MEYVYSNEDHGLLENIRKGEDEKSFNLLYRKYWDDVYRNSFYLLKDEELAKDVTQDVFVSLWNNREKLQINNLKAYLSVCVRNRVLRIFEKKKLFVPFEVLVSDTEKVLNQESADFLTLKHEFLEAYKNLLQSLPLQRRKIFDAYFEEGLSTDEIADRLSLSRKTVQNQLGRAMSFLKTNLSHLSSFLFTLFF